ncbi:ParB/RepB/Spo0J family partition protein [Solimonas variicoloris]|uniref:ParB/RepB/Spo0J family partition protein n=1 Tax=Solimonas variicoloris TaxID=254408 RepID=UPI00037F3B78|nr:ParB/RepB/Spo0J family partition protein [Solimonas variicoloris]
MNAGAAVEPKPITLGIADVAELPAYQVREDGTDPRKVREYAEAMAQGVTFPPIVVTALGGAYVLLSGAHRLAAVRKNGGHEIKAHCVEGLSHADAVRLALASNMTHGLGLSKKDLRRCLLMFVDANAHRKGQGRVMSSRELAAGPLAGRVSYRTVLNWLEQDRPKVHAEMTSGEPGGDQAAPFDPAADANRAAVERAQTALRELRAAVPHLSDRRTRTALARELQATLAAIRKGPAGTLPDAQWMQDTGHA